MKRCMALVALSTVLASPALAADRPLAVTIGGRPISRSGPVALLHGGVAFANLGELVRSYGGLVTVTGGATSITVRSRTATFVPGSASAMVDKAPAAMPGPAFIEGGVLYVPLTFFVTRVAGGTVRIDAAAATARIAASRESVPAATATP